MGRVIKDEVTRSSEYDYLLYSDDDTDVRDDKVKCRHHDAGVTRHSTQVVSESSTNRGKDFTQDRGSPQRCSRLKGAAQGTRYSKRSTKKKQPADEYRKSTLTTDYCMMSFIVSASSIGKRPDADIGIYSELPSVRAHWKAIMDLKFQDIDALLPFSLPTIPKEQISSIFADGKEIVLGTGSSGSVALMTYSTLKGIKKVAVKTVDVKSTENKPMACHQQEYYLKRAGIEARALNKLSIACDVFPNVYGIMTRGINDFAIVMEYIGRGTLLHFLEYERRSGYCNKLQWLNISRDIATGIKHMHDIDLLHNDIALRNVMFTSNGGRICAKIIDLGNVSIASSGQARNYKKRFANEELGAVFSKKWPEIAPEFFVGAGIETKATDIYALGVLFTQVGSENKMSDLINLGSVMTQREPNVRPDAADVLHKIVKRINTKPAPQNQ